MNSSLPDRRAGNVVLIVDDVPENLAVLHDALDESGFTVLVANQGRAALERAVQVVPDIILLDVLMPGMDGFEVCRLLRDNLATRHIPVIFMTGLDEAEHVVRAFEAGGTDVAAYMAELGPRAELDFDGYVLDRVEMHHCNYNWKTFIEVYLEDYHVGPFHPGLGQFVTCDDLRWEFKNNYSVQTVGVANRLGKAGSPIYERWHKALLQYRNGVPPRFGAIWLTYYPHIMIEWYPHVLTVSTLHPNGPNSTMNMVEFYYPEEIAAFEREFVEAQQAAYMETCKEDDEIAERMDAGRAALMARGDNEAGPYQSPMEDGMQHFHEWYQQQMAHC